ncbi:hypothetical protein GCM10025864_10550 [Luteimicrobium album]|uniref:Major facilitator superfamily (MFS) profile domain-containing protein n=1 Tax=Luteimicrobium album TaxID=1054550 RepID=A0ABQ6HZ60_9MICO|nr:hypothetical protein GCM10025864_10550 [Luteimicrobium album]
MASNSSGVSRASVGLRSGRGPILLSLMLSTALVALDSTVIATAIPTITADLGGFTQFPWLLSIYLLAQAASTPIYGKLADIVGRKPLMLAGVAVFLAGSVLAGFAWSMPALIVFRAVQGLGAGAIMPMSITIAGDIYTVEERATAQGYLASVWGVSAVAGPLIGGIFSEWVSWRWIFWVNIPLCLVAGWILTRSFHEKVERRPHRVDYLGATLLTASSILVLLGLLEGGQAWAWGPPPGWRCSAAGWCWASCSCCASASRQSPSCRCGCSGAGSSSPPRSPRSRSAPSSWVSRPTCRRSSRSASGRARSWPASRSPR